MDTSKRQPPHPPFTKMQRNLIWAPNRVLFQDICIAYDLNPAMQFYILWPSHLVGHPRTEIVYFYKCDNSHSDEYNATRDLCITNHMKVVSL